MNTNNIHKNTDNFSRGMTSRHEVLRLIQQFNAADQGADINAMAFIYKRIENIGLQPRRVLNLSTRMRKIRFRTRMEKVHALLPALDASLDDPDFDFLTSSSGL